jgi:hypothetical protein
MKKIIFISLIIISFSAFGGDIQTGVDDTTNWLQVIGLSICGLGGVAGGVMMGFNNESGAVWVVKSLIAAAVIGCIPTMVEQIGNYFK